MKRTAALFLAILIPALFLCGCQKRQLDEPGKASTTCANITMGMGNFASRDSFIYIANYEEILEYDILTGKTVRLPVNAGEFSAYLNIQKDHIYYTEFTGSKLFRVNREGKEMETLLEDGVAGGRFFYIDGDCCYYLVDEYTETTATSHLYRNNLSFDAPEQIAEDIFTYYVDETDIYIITQENESTFYLHRSPKDQISFERIELSFSPICVYTYDGDIYLATTLQEVEPYSYQIIRYSDGEETPLPIYSLFYQILDGCVIYMDELTFSGSYTLKSYDLATGETKDLFENVMKFGVVEERYICALCMGAEYIDSSSWMLYDWQTGETKQMYP